MSTHDDDELLDEQSNDTDEGDAGGFGAGAGGLAATIYDNDEESVDETADEMHRGPVADDED